MQRLYMLTSVASMQSEVTHLQDLGCGTFGNVWLGHNATFGKVAVKTVKVSASSLKTDSYNSNLGVRGAELAAGPVPVEGIA